MMIVTGIGDLTGIVVIIVLLVIFLWLLRGRWGLGYHGTLTVAPFAIILHPTMMVEETIDDIV